MIVILNQTSRAFGKRSGADLSDAANISPEAVVNKTMDCAKVFHLVPAKQAKLAVDDVFKYHAQDLTKVKETLQDVKLSQAQVN